MYCYMVSRPARQKPILHKDYLTYVKSNVSDNLYVVAVNNPKLTKYQREFIKRRSN